MGRAANNRDDWWGATKDRSAAQVDATAHASEAYIPFEPAIVAQTDEFIVVDKPPFLPSTPNGRIVANTVQERLRRKLGEPEIVALHRLDVMTSGLMLLSRNPETRASYQHLFQSRGISKEYECLTVMPDDWEPGETREVELHLHDNPGGRGVAVVKPGEDGAKWAMTEVTFLGGAAADIGDVLGSSHGVGCPCGTCGSVMQVGRWRLRPLTGRTHQLRATMNHLDYPILGEDTYGPMAGPQAGPRGGNLLGVGGSNVADGVGASSYASAPQLRLLATKLAFTDPLSGEKRSYRTARDLTQRVEALADDERPSH
nr:pseudouridine synthase [Corynebacterium lactis]